MSELAHSEPEIDYGHNPEASGSGPLDTAYIPATVAATNFERKRRLEEAMHTKVVDLSLIPKVESNGSERYIITITSDGKMQASGSSAVAELDPNEIYLLNSLLILRNRPAAPVELAAFGMQLPREYLPGCTRSLEAKIKSLGARDVIIRSGEKRNSRYQLDLGLVFKSGVIEMPPEPYEAGELKTEEDDEGQPDDRSLGFPVGFLARIEALEETLRKPPSHSEIMSHLRQSGFYKPN